MTSPQCNAGNSIAVAFAESVIHEVGRFVDGRYEVPITALAERWIVRFRCERRKTLCSDHQRRS